MSSRAAFDALYAPAAPVVAPQSSHARPRPSHAHLQTLAVADAHARSLGHLSAVELSRDVLRDLGESAGEARHARHAAVSDALSSSALAKATPRGGRPSHSVATVAAVHGYSINMPPSKLGRREMLDLWVQFRGLCALSTTPLGVDRATFAACVPSLRLEDNVFVSRVFELLDAVGSNAISWEDFASSLNKIERGSPLARAEFLHSVYDRRGAGGVSRDDLFFFFAASFGVSVEGTASAPAPTDAERGAAPAPAVDCRSLIERSLSERDALQQIVRGFSEATFDAIARPGESFITVGALREYLRDREADDAAGAPVDIAAVFGRSLLLDSMDEHIIKSQKKKETERRVALAVGLLKRNEAVKDLLRVAGTG